MFWLLFIIFIPAKQIYVFSLFSCHWLKVLKNRWQGFFSIFLQVGRTTFLFVKRFCIIHYYMACRSGKKNFFAHKIFFWYSIILFLSTWSFFFVLNQLLLLTWNTFSCNISTFFRHQITFCATPNFSFSTQNYFSCNAKFLLWTSFRMLCHGDIFLFSHSNRNIITCQKKNNNNKISFLCDTKI